MKRSAACADQCGRTGNAAATGPYSPEQIHAIRIRLGLKQSQLADVLNVSDKTVKAWEQGINPPSGPALRLLQIAERHPEVFWERREA
ncbi:MAG: helix-turn-helix domain-containing protein [Thermomicrobia bacterium]|nr:helix-turn-helix domain-containing protein [Thermomicrobia bacterium]